MKQTKQKEIEQSEADYLERKKDILDYWKAGYLDSREASELLDQIKKGLIHK